MHITIISRYLICTLFFITICLSASENGLRNGYKKNGSTFELPPDTLDQLIRVSLNQYQDQSGLMRNQANLIEQQALAIQQKDKQLESREKEYEKSLIEKDGRLEKNTTTIRRLRWWSLTATLVATGLVVEKITTRYPQLLSHIGALLSTKPSPPAS